VGTDAPTAATAEPYDRSARRTIEALYVSEHARLIRYLRRRVDPEAARDIAHDTFVRAAESPQLLELANPRAYLCRIARNLLIDRERARRRRPQPLPLNEAGDAPIAASHDHDLLAIDLERTLAMLPARTRAVFVMHRLEEKAHREIHHELGISMGAVEYHMARALAHLRGTLGREGDPLPEK
jgi:RNA polymerase sigma-70 factor (ECF subfamily)